MNKDKVSEDSEQWTDHENNQESIGMECTCTTKEMIEACQKDCPYKDVYDESPSDIINW